VASDLLAQSELPMKDLRAYAKTFASQGGVEIGEWLEAYAAAVVKGAAIVEVGCWLGAGTAQLALGAMESGAPIHVYDRWMATAAETEKAAAYGIHLALGENTLARVQTALSPFDVEINYHRGDIREAKWPGYPIGLYVDDATKIEPIWQHAMTIFRPHFVPGAILVLQDFHFDEKGGEQYGAQKKYMAEHGEEFELFADRMGGTTAAAFRYLG